MPVILTLHLDSLGSTRHWCGMHWIVGTVLAAYAKSFSVCSIVEEREILNFKFEAQ